MLHRYELAPVMPPTDRLNRTPDAPDDDPNRPRTHPGANSPARAAPSLCAHARRADHAHAPDAPATFVLDPPALRLRLDAGVGRSGGGAGHLPHRAPLTHRLERLQRGVEHWGDGDLSTRVPEHGDDEVAFLAERFNHAAERVETLIDSHEALLASHKSLLANASHELRSPLTRIRMGLELMGAGTSPAFKAEISRNINELDQLIDEILLASRLDAREADLGTVESVDLIGLAAEECARVDAELDLPHRLAHRRSHLELAVQGSASCCAAWCATCWKTPAVTAPARSA